MVSKSQFNGVTIVEVVHTTTTVQRISTEPENTFVWTNARDDNARRWELVLTAENSELVRSWTKFRPCRTCSIGALPTVTSSRAERTVDGLWAAIGRIIDTFTPAECRNYFAAAGYDAT